MSEFVFLFRADETDQQEAMGTPERAQESMRAWLDWIGVLKAKGHLKDPGQPLDTRGKVVRGANKLITDGPYVETKDLVLGYLIIEARDLAHSSPTPHDRTHRFLRAMTAGLEQETNPSRNRRHQLRE